MKLERKDRAWRHGIAPGVLIAMVGMVAGCATPTAWDGRTAPYVSLHICRNQFETHFPDLADRLENEVVMAAEEWFGGAGAHVRLYYAGSLAPTHPACADVPTLVEPRPVGTPPPGPRPPDRSVVVTAAPTLTHRLRLPGIEPCEFAMVDRWETRSQGGPVQLSSTLSAVRITLARSQTCGSGIEPWPWPDPQQGTTAQTLGPGRVLMKSLGHALGLAEMPRASESVMGPIDPAVHLPRWHLQDGDVQALRRLYGPAQSSQYWIETRDAGHSWTIRARAPRGNSRDSLGAAGCRVATNPPAATETFLIAETIIDSSGRSTVATYLADGQGNMVGSPQFHAASNRKPSVACLPSGFLLGWVTPSGQVAIERSADASHWVGSSVPTSWISAHAPALAVAGWEGVVLAATSDERSGTRFLASRDGGASFIDSGAPNPSQKPRFPFGLSCAEALRKCFMTTGDHGFSRHAYEFSAGQLRWVATSGGGEVPNLGIAMAATSDGSGFAFVRRYKPGSSFYATAGAALDQIGGGVQLRADANPYQFVSQPFARAISDSPVGLMRSDAIPAFVAIATYNVVYNSAYVLVPAPGQ